MTTVTFLSSVQGHQVERVQAVVRQLREREPAVSVEVVEGPRNVELLRKHKIQFGPAVVIDGRLEFVGVPRIGMLVNRLAIARKRAEANYPVADPWKVEEAKEASNVVTLLRHPAAAPSPPAFVPHPPPEPRPAAVPPAAPIPAPGPAAKKPEPAK